MTTTTNENAFSPDYIEPPGGTIADLLEEQGMTQTELARRLGVSLKHLNQVVKGGASISAELALGLEKVFSVPANFWLTRDSIYRAYAARQAERLDLKKALGWATQFPLKELKTRGYLPKKAEEESLVGALLQFLGIASPEQWECPAVSYRKSQKLESDDYALAAWLRIGEIEAREIDCGPFDADRFRDTLENARAFTCLHPDQWHETLVRSCAEAGVAVVIVEHFHGARVNGATRWLSPTKALVQLSLRYKWEDIFWFTFFHEAGHVLLHRKKDVFVEPTKRPKEASMDPRLLRVEQEADRFAARVLIPQHFERRLRNLQLPDVSAFARQLGIAPAIVVGRLQHEGVLPYSHGNNLRRQFEFSDD